jgi:YHS domain-containing protein
MENRQAVEGSSGQIIIENENRANPPREPIRAKTVCGRDMTTDSDWYPRAEYKGRIIHFCTEFCLDAFRADPDRFYAAHSKKKSKP